MNSDLASTQVPVTRQIPLIRRVFSFPVAISFLLSVLAVLTVRSRFDDPDLWWHLKLGQVIWTTHSIPKSDLFSYTTHQHAYIAHEWLSQLTIYGAYRLGGYSGLMLWLCCLSSAVLIAGYALCSLYSGNAKVAFLGAMAIWIFSTIGLSIRPQLIGYLFLLFELILLHLGRTRNPRWFYALPPLFALWINCHGSFLLGLAIAATLLFSSWFSFQSGSLIALQWEPRVRRGFIQALLLSIAALFLNPIGIKLVLYPMGILFNSPINIGQITEWHPLQLGDPRGLALLAVLGCIALLVIARHSLLFWHELLWLTLVTWSAASHQRLLFPFGLVAAPILSRLMADFYDNYKAEEDRPLPNVVLIAASVIVAFLAFPSRRNLASQVERQNPTQAVEFIKAHHLTGPLLNQYEYGGYLIWALPEYPVFIDGRADIFEWTGVLAEYDRWIKLDSNPVILLDKYGINLCLLSRETPLTNVLPLLHGWTQVYSDQNSIMFIRSSAIPDR